MADSTIQIANEYPLPSHRFVVAVDDEKIAFSTVSGLDIKYGKMEYRDGIGNYFKMPGLLEPVSITLKKGVFRQQNELYAWISTISLNKVEKKDIMISLTDEAGTSYLVSWNVANAFPTSLATPNFDANSNEIIIQELTLTADRLTIQVH